MPSRPRVSFLAVLALAALATPLAAQSSPAEKELTDLENRWAEATVKADVAFFDTLYADEYLAIDPEGATFTKAQDIANVKSGNFKMASYKLDEMKVRVHGDVAVVTGRNTVKATYMGKDISGSYRFTDTFVKRGGRWQVLTTQGTAVAKP
jgi:ketosteroid isomerase-like protein